MRDTACGKVAQLAWQSLLHFTHSPKSMPPAVLLGFFHALNHQDQFSMSIRLGMQQHYCPQGILDLSEFPYSLVLSWHPGLSLIPGSRGR